MPVAVDIPRSGYREPEPVFHSLAVDREELGPGRSRVHVHAPRPEPERGARDRALGGAGDDVVRPVGVDVARVRHRPAE